MNRAQQFDLVWTTSPPEAAHFIGYSLSRRQLPWVADFRDPWADYPLEPWDPISRSIIKVITRGLLRRASSITACSEGIAASLHRASGREVVCVRNGFDSDFMPNTAPARQRRLGYFGRVDPRLQSFECLWGPLRALRDRGRPWELEAFLTGGGGGGARIEVPPDLEDLVSISPTIPRARALEEMRTMAALLVLAFEGRSGDAMVPGKTFEYAGAGVPILVVAPEAYEVRRLVEASGIGLGGWTQEEIVQRLADLEAFTVSDEGRRRLSRATSARALLRIFEDAIAGSEIRARRGAGPTA